MVWFYISMATNDAERLQKLVAEHDAWAAWCSTAAAEEFTGFRTEKMRQQDEKETVRP